MFSSKARVTGWRLAAVVGAAGIVAVGAVLATAATGSAAASGSSYQIQLDPKTPPPITAANFTSTGSCAGYVAPQDDGWHFTLPGGSTFFVSLDVSFNSPSHIVYTPDHQQAYVATTPGAQLTQASATVITLAGQQQIQYLELANTCPAGATAPPSTPTATPSAYGGYPYSYPFPFSLPSGFSIPTFLPSNFNALQAADQSCFPSSSTSTATSTSTSTATSTSTSTSTATSTSSTSTSTATSTSTSSTATPTSTATESCFSTDSDGAGDGSTSTSTSGSSSSANSSDSSTASPNPSSDGGAPTPSAVSSSLPVTG